MALPSIQEFEQVLRGILSHDNNIRNQAETHFNKAKTQPDYCITCLLQLLRTSPDVEVRFLIFLQLLDAFPVLHLATKMHVQNRGLSVR